MAQLLNKKVKKHVAAIHVSGQLSLVQHKVSNILLINAYDELLTEEKHRININLLAKSIGFDSHNIEYLKTALKGMMGIILEWNLLDQYGNEDWEAMPVLSYVRLTRGYCYYSYPQELKKRLYNPDVYAIVSAAIQQKFSSSSALKLYENLVRFRKVHSSGWIELELIKKILGVDKSSYYDEFKRLNSKLIKPAMDEINHLSDLFVSMDAPRRENRRVVALKFMIEDNPDHLPHTEGLLDEKKDQLSSSQAIDDQSLPTYQRLISFGLTVRTANKALADYDIQYIEDNLKVAELDFKAGRVKNLPAYTVAALRDDYRPGPSVIEQAVMDQKNSQVHTKELRDGAVHLLICLYKEYERIRLDRALEQLGEDERMALEEHFKSMLHSATGAGDAVIRKFFLKGGLASPPVQAVYRAMVKERLLEPVEEQAFADFIVQSGYDADELKAAAGFLLPKSRI